MNWVFIGAGNMASSLIGGLVGSGADIGSIAVVDSDTAACERAQSRFGIRSDPSLNNILRHIGHEPMGIVIAVKPHTVEAVCRSVTEYHASLDDAGKTVFTPLLVSVAAGVRTSSMEHWLPANTALIRCMPNTPSLMGLGATALYANLHCSDKDKIAAESLLNTAGMTLWVSKESALDAVTAVSGSGPAYFFYLIEQMSAAGVALGLDESTARDLAIETAYGAASMARTREHAPATLRENVTSKGGTTAAALQVFQDQKLPEMVHQAMQAAHDRAVELGDQLAPD